MLYSVELRGRRTEKQMNKEQMNDEVGSMPALLVICSLLYCLIPAKKFRILKETSNSLRYSIFLVRYSLPDCVAQAGIFPWGCKYRRKWKKGCLKILLIDLRGCALYKFLWKQPYHKGSQLIEYSNNHFCSSFIHSPDSNFCYSIGRH